MTLGIVGHVNFMDILENGSDIMILFKGESSDVNKYQSREEVIYKYYVKHIEKIKSELKHINVQLKELRADDCEKNSESIKNLIRLRQRLRYNLNKKYDLLFKHMHCLSNEDEERIWKDLKNKNIL